MGNVTGAQLKPEQKERTHRHEEIEEAQAETAPLKAPQDLLNRTRRFSRRPPRTEMFETLWKSLLLHCNPTRNSTNKAVVWRCFIH